MASFPELYQTLLAVTVRKNLKEAVRQVRANGGYDPSQLDCLLHPQKYAPVWRLAECDCEGAPACSAACEFDAIKPGANGQMAIDLTACVGCSACINACKGKKLTASRDLLPALDAVRRQKGLSYALVAPAFCGQFGPEVTPGKLRAALRMLGFDGMLEVALFADLLTLKEAFEFDKNIQSKEDYQLTSCCCPVWIGMIRKVYSQLVPHLPASVSPMIACGRSVKLLHPGALTVFIGPCIAKKAEAREAGLAGAVDYVLTFEELRDAFEAAGILPERMEELEKEHSTRAGRIYAYTGGVSEAVRSAVQRLNPHRQIEVCARQAQGVPACKKMIQEVLDKSSTANFYEGMGCIGGCVGGPKRLIPASAGRRCVEQYGGQSAFPTPIDSPYLIELLHRLGIDTVEQLLHQSTLFTRSL